MATLAETITELNTSIASVQSGITEQQKMIDFYDGLSAGTTKEELSTAITNYSETAGDPETNDDVFACPTLDSLEDQAFCSARSLTNNSEFGVYSPIVNGTPYRVNWRVISIPSDDDPQNTLIKERVKIAGDKGGTVTFEDAKGLGMEGIPSPQGGS